MSPQYCERLHTPLDNSSNVAPLKHEKLIKSNFFLCDQVSFRVRDEASNIKTEVVAMSCLSYGCRTTQKAVIDEYEAMVEL
jgi:hypothetical protein